MTRTLGFVLLQVAAALFAHGRMAEITARTEALRSFCDLLGQMHGMLESDGSPMPLLLETLSKRCTGQARAFTDALNSAMDSLGQRRFQEIWEQALAENTGFLGAEPRQELASLGGVLGRYDSATQLDALDSCRLHLRRHLDEIQNAKTQDTRLTLGLSFSTSLLLGILLI